MKRPELRIGTVAALGLAGLAWLWAAGCASQRNSTAPRPGSGIAEFRSLATGADQAIRRALDSLATVEAQSNQCSPAVLSSFSNEVQRLQVESVQVRARAQAIQARGDAYFERWHDNMAHVSDPKIRALAESRRPLLQQSFQQIKALSQEAREAFVPFLSGLRQLRNGLEKDPACAGSENTRERIRQAREKGKQVDRCLARIVSELDSMSAMLAPAQRAAQK
jgi:hypothetical protein